MIRITGVTMAVAALGVVQVNLIPVPDDYTPIAQLQKNRERNEVKEKEKKVPVLD